MAWILVLVGGVFEVAWAGTLKLTMGYSKLIPSIYNLIFMALSVFCISTAAKTLPIGTAYAVWTGIGAVGAVVVGILFYKDPITITRIFYIILIDIGIIGLNVTSS
ncbi:MAG: multidrug efflux SMR transporter [Clostridiales bacterium]